MAVKSGRLMQVMLDQQVLHGIIAFGRFFNACWRESVRPLLYFCSCLPLTYIIHRRRLLLWKNCMFFDYVLLQTLARCCYDNIGSFAISINTLLRIFLIYRNNILLKNGSGRVWAVEYLVTVYSIYVLISVLLSALMLCSFMLCAASA